MTLRAAVRSLALDQAAAASSVALRVVGIDNVLLKGPAMARRLYADQPDQRVYGDIDLLVAPAAFESAQQRLAALGYQPVFRYARDDDLANWHERAWRIPGQPQLVLDLHRGFAGVRDPAAFWTALRSSAELIRLAGTLVHVPDESCAALIVALHAAAPGNSDQPRTDLARAVRVLPETTWRRAAVTAQRCRALPAFAVGLRLDPTGAALASRLRLSARPSTLEWLSAHRRSPTAYALARMAGLPTGRARLRHFCLRLVPSPEVMRFASPLARRGPAGLLLAYCVRLGRHARATPRAVLELRAAARLARASASAGAGHDRPRSARRLRLVRRLARAALTHRADGVRLTVWAMVACRRVRRQLATGRLDGLRLAAPPPTRQDPQPELVAGALRAVRATCLERALVRQRWYAAHRSARVLVIGVTAPGTGFHAHAWLDGDPEGEHEPMVEILRRPPSATWLGSEPDAWEHRR